MLFIVKSIKTIDQGYLACRHHLYMTLGIHYALQSHISELQPKILIIGLGGGGLCTYIQQCFKYIILYEYFIIK